MLKVGGNVFVGNEAYDIEKIAFEACQMGYTAVYVPEFLTIKHIDEVRDAKRIFKKYNLTVAEVGYWDNLLDLRMDVRKENHEEMIRKFQLAEELEAKCVVNTAGGFCEGRPWDMHCERNFSEEHFQEAVSMAQKFIDYVKPKKTTFAYEVFMYNSIDSPEQYARLIREVDRKEFAVHLDLTNMLRSPREIFAANDVVERCIQLFADKIVSVHIKDAALVHPAITTQIKEMVLGEGQVDLVKYIKSLADLPQEITMMLEHYDSREEYQKSMQYIKHIVLHEKINNVELGEIQYT